MDTDNQKQPISDDQELAKALAGVTEQANNMGFEETGNPPAINPVAPATDDPTGQTMSPVAPMGEQAPEEVVAPAMPDPVVGTQNTTVDPALDSVKQAALSELRPLIDKLDVEPEEKFNTYLLLIRSTDDKDLIAPAHEAAKAIADEGKKAQALLDIIKEIDFLSNPQQQQ